MIPTEWRAALNACRREERRREVQLVLADWFSDQRELEAERCTRWMVATGRVPLRAYGSWRWACFVTPPVLLPHRSRLAYSVPQEVYRHFERAPFSVSHHRTRADAECALLVAWKRAVAELPSFEETVR